MNGLVGTLKVAILGAIFAFYFRIYLLAFVILLVIHMYNVYTRLLLYLLM